MLYRRCTFHPCAPCSLLPSPLVRTPAAESAARVFDCLLVEGSKALHRAGLALFKVCGGGGGVCVFVRWERGSMLGECQSACVCFRAWGVGFVVCMSGCVGGIMHVSACCLHQWFNWPVLESTCKATHVTLHPSGHLPHPSKCTNTPSPPPLLQVHEAALVSTCKGSLKLGQVLKWRVARTYDSDLLMKVSQLPPWGCQRVRWPSLFKGRLRGAIALPVRLPPFPSLFNVRSCLCAVCSPPAHPLGTT